MKTQYLLTLVGSSDDLPIALFDTKEQVEAFVGEHHPFPVDGGGCETSGPLAKACNVAGRGPSLVMGFQVWKFEDGRPVANFNQKWCDGDWPTRGELDAMPDDEQADFFAALSSDPIT